MSRFVERNILAFSISIDGVAVLCEWLVGTVKASPHVLGMSDLWPSADDGPDESGARMRARARDRFNPSGERATGTGCRTVCSTG